MRCFVFVIFTFFSYLLFSLFRLPLLLVPPGPSVFPTLMCFTWVCPITCPRICICICVKPQCFISSLPVLLRIPSKRSSNFLVKFFLQFDLIRSSCFWDFCLALMDLFVWLWTTFLPLNHAFKSISVFVVKCQIMSGILNWLSPNIKKLPLKLPNGPTGTH